MRSPHLLDAKIRDQAREKLTLGPLIPDDQELDARYLGQYESLAHLARGLFAMKSPHIVLSEWPYCHIDWEAAATALFLDGSLRDLLEVDGHWFDALAEPAVIH